MTEPVFVVGCGAITCLGQTLDETWRRLIAGESGIRRHAALDPGEYLRDVAGMVEGPAVGPAEDRDFARLSARFLGLGMTAARAAWTDAGLDGLEDRIDRDRVAVAAGSAFGGMDFLEAQQNRMRKRGDRSVSPFLIPGLLINQLGGQISQALGLYGPGVAPANACASGGHAIILGAMAIKAGDADLALCGASESAFSPAIVNGFATMKALHGGKPGDRAEDDPSRSSRPFSIDRGGFVMSEGAGMVVLASKGTVDRLGLSPLAELAGYAMNSDGHHMSTPSPDRIRRCLTLAMEKAGLTAADLDYYNAHGTSTTINDRVETTVLKDVLGDRAAAVPVSSIKGAIGHSLGAASAIEAAVCARALRDRIAPPTINYLADPELDLDYVPNEARPMTMNVVASASFGFGGTNNVLILRRPRD